MSTIKSSIGWGLFLSIALAGCSSLKQTSETTEKPLLSASAQISSSQPTPTKELNCNNAQTQAAINQCAKLKAEAADKRLNQVYQQLRSRLQNSQQKTKLVNVQTIWIKYRDASCDFEKSRYEGGSIAPSVYFGCLERVTGQRVKDLESYLEPR